MAAPTTIEPRTNVAMEEVFNRRPLTPIAQRPRSPATARPSSGLIKLAMPAADPASHAHIALPVLLAQATASEAASAQVRVNVWAMKFIPIKTYQGEMHSKSTAT